MLYLHHCAMFVLEPCTTARYLCSFFSGNAIYPAFEAAAGEASSRLLFEDNGFKLRLDQLEMSDAANYSCQAENFYGRDAITYHLQVKCKKYILRYTYLPFQVLAHNFLLSHLILNGACTVTHGLSVFTKHSAVIHLLF